MRRRLPLGPAEGWLTLASSSLICLTMAWAIDDARWVLGNPRYLDLLVPPRSEGSSSASSAPRSAGAAG